MSRRGMAPTVGVVLFVLVTVVLAAAVSASVLEAPDDPPRMAVEASADAGTGRIALTHTAGDAIDVSTLRLRVAIDGVPLEYQPPVPFFSAVGFASGPTGPFNTAADQRWTAGETAAFRLAGTNDPPLDPGVRVTVSLYVEDRRIATVETTA